MTTVPFSLGPTVITPAALDVLHPDDVQLALARHAASDWGELCPADRLANEVALKEGRRLFSVFRDRSGRKFYVITESDRSVTTVLLPDDY